SPAHWPKRRRTSVTTCVPTCPRYWMKPRTGATVARCAMFEQQITPALTHLSRVVRAAERDEVSRHLAWGFKGRVVPDCYLIAADMLLEEGWKLLGSGAYSVALTHPSMAGKVLKVSLDEDDAGPIWWDFCARNQGRPYVPVQYLHGTLMGLSFVIMDRLELDLCRAAH